MKDRDKNIRSLIGALLWVAVCLSANHKYNFASGHSEIVSIVYFAILGVGTLAISSLLKNQG